MRMLGFLVGGLVSCIDISVCLFVPARPPNQAAGHSLDKVASLSPVFHTFHQNTLVQYYIVITTNNIIITIITNTLYHYYYISYYQEEGYQ